MAQEPHYVATTARRMPVDLRDKVRFIPAIEPRDIFREMVREEVRSGRLTRTRRRRIVQYASHLRLSAVEVGRLIAAYREELHDSNDPGDRSLFMRLAEMEVDQDGEPSRWAVLGMIALKGLTIGLCVLAGLLFVNRLVQG